MAKDFENVKMARADERPAVRTTIVGGRPPGSGKPVGDIPRGVEVLLKKAAVDAAFRELLLAERSRVAARIGLTLAPAEEAMVDNIPAAQLDAVVAGTRVSPNLHAAFMTYTAAVMLAALGTLACDGSGPGPTPEGIRPDIPAPAAQSQKADQEAIAK